MSDFDEMDFDGLDEELAEAFEEDPENLQPEDVLKMVMVNRHKNTSITVEIKDKDDDVVDLPELITQILNYVKDQLKSEEGNLILDQLMPLISQSLVSGLGRMMGIQNTAFLLTNNITKTSLLNMMIVAMLLLKFVQENNLTIFTHEKEVTAEEMDEIDRKAKASSVMTMGSMMGMDPREVLKEMVRQGQLTSQDLADLVGEDNEKEGKGNN